MSRNVPGVLVVAWALSLAGCASALEETVRRQAAVDMSCPEGQVAVRDLRSDNYVRDFSVSACGKQAHYQAACSMVGSCTAYQSRELGEHPLAGSQALTAGVEDLQAAPVNPPTIVMAGASEAVPMVPVVEAAPVVPVVAAPTVAGENGASEVVAGSSVTVVNSVATHGVAAGEGATVTLRSACPRTVTLFVGSQPGAEDGLYMTLGAGSSIAPKLATGTSLWLLDARRAGLASVSIDASTREIAIAENCSGLAAR
ncbi:MAG: hypothetical protein IPO88_32730 [Nannocystis sp.]|uniref:hypothetical protein n=1 Tax=Nannocystis sp. TaxID=1962667 RepID=UPI002422CB63|nr:hypothetical protein [Nannocystis sp.]MBK9758200.1 hypothetical protein [Nannocystis sp.]